VASDFLGTASALLAPEASSSVGHAAGVDRFAQVLPRGGAGTPPTTQCRSSGPKESDRVAIEPRQTTFECIERFDYDQGHVEVIYTTPARGA